jgi:hypothetical protein
MTNTVIATAQRTVSRSSLLFLFKHDVDLDVNRYTFLSYLCPVDLLVLNKCLPLEHINIQHKDSSDQITA